MILNEQNLHRLLKPNARLHQRDGAFPARLVQALVRPAAGRLDAEVSRLHLPLSEVFEPF